MMLITALQVAKSEYTDADCEDAWHIGRDGRRFAIADGVADSVFAGEWAQIVSRGVCELETLTLAAFQAQAADWREQWTCQLPQGDLPWFVMRKLQQVGAYTTVAVLELGLSRGRGTFSILALGDSCVFQVREDRLLTAYPYAAESQFSGRTPALSSWSESHSASSGGVAKPVVMVGERRAHDRFVLASDALAQYLLNRVAVGDPGIRAALNFRRTPGAFSSWVAARRDAREMRDDDTTLIDIRT